MTRGTPILPKVHRKSPKLTEEEDILQLGLSSRWNSGDIEMHRVLGGPPPRAL